MAGSANQYVYGLGVTAIAVGLSANIQVVPPKGCNGYFLNYQSGGTLAVVNGQSAITTAGYVLKTTDQLPIYGPATFYLAAAGATAIAGLMFTYSAGWSSI